MQLRSIYCNTHVYTFHVCLCLLALTFVCNSTYLLKCSFQIYQKSIAVFIRSSKQRDALKALSHGAIFLATYFFANFSKLWKLIHRSPHFDLISLEIVFSDLLLCTAVSKKKIEGVKLFFWGGGGYVKNRTSWGVRKNRNSRRVPKS